MPEGDLQSPWNGRGRGGGPPPPFMEVPVAGPVCGVAGLEVEGSFLPMPQGVWISRACEGCLFVWFWWW